MTQEISNLDKQFKAITNTLKRELENSIKTIPNLEKGVMSLFYDLPIGEIIEQSSLIIAMLPKIAPVLGPILKKSPHF